MKNKRKNEKTENFKLMFGSYCYCSMCIGVFRVGGLGDAVSQQQQLKEPVNQPPPTDGILDVLKDIK